MRKSVLIGLVLCMAMLTVGCGTTPAPSDPKQQEQLQENGNTAVETTLGAGEWYVGEDILPGRYTITSPEPDGGNVAIYNEGEDFATDSTIIDPDGNIGVKSWTYELESGQKIKISNTDAVLFTPKED